MAPRKKNGNYVGKHAERCERRIGGTGCPRCDLWFLPHRNQLQNHLNTTDPSFFYVCPGCGKSACNSRTLGPHLQKCFKFRQHLATRGIFFEKMDIKPANATARGLRVPRPARRPEPPAPMMSPSTQPEDFTDNPFHLDQDHAPQQALFSPPQDPRSVLNRLALQLQPPNGDDPYPPPQAQPGQHNINQNPFVPGTTFGGMTMLPGHGAAFQHTAPMVPSTSFAANFDPRYFAGSNVNAYHPPDTIQQHPVRPLSSFMPDEYDSGYYSTPTPSDAHPTQQYFAAPAGPGHWEFDSFVADFPDGGSAENFAMVQLSNNPRVQNPPYVTADDVHRIRSEDGFDYGIGIHWVPGVQMQHPAVGQGTFGADPGGAATQPQGSMPSQASSMNGQQDHVADHQIGPLVDPNLVSCPCFTLFHEDPSCPYHGL